MNVCGGLAAFGDDLMLALAQKIVSGDEEDAAETVEEVFGQARDAEAVSEEYLVDDGWRVVEVEPETVAVNGNGHAAADNGHHDEVPEPQQSLFSWAEFMAEPVKPRGRGPQASAPRLTRSSSGLWKWSKREEDPVGAGR